jgi:hypothetical protein
MADNKIQNCMYPFKLLSNALITCKNFDPEGNDPNVKHLKENIFEILLQMSVKAENFASGDAAGESGIKFEQVVPADEPAFESDGEPAAKARVYGTITTYKFNMPRTTKTTMGYSAPPKSAEYKQDNPHKIAVADPKAKATLYRLTIMGRTPGRSADGDAPPEADGDERDGDERDGVTPPEADGDERDGDERDGVTPTAGDAGAASGSPAAPPGDSHKIDLQKLQEDLVISGKNYCHDLVVIESKDPKTLDLHVDGVKIDIAKTLPKFVQLNFEINAISSEPLDVPANAATSDRKQFSHIINITTSSVLDKNFMSQLVSAADNPNTVASRTAAALDRLDSPDAAELIAGIGVTEEEGASAAAAAAARVARDAASTRTPGGGRRRTRSQRRKSSHR